ncbi:MAG: alpha amylase C-terminal domain-containing protein [Bacteroidales bacterium]|nr:alpha amylase C-terminal domain-containing protein [Bacteroidales bacterium]MBN2818850.1 alpha amylase C-terminal domain-containing protein [Bacteroidales bacterium]
MSKLPKIVRDDPWLEPFAGIIEARTKAVFNLKNKLVNEGQNLSDFATGHLYYGLHLIENNWIFREFAPNANKIFLVGDFNGWQETENYRLQKLDNGNWEIILEKKDLTQGDKYKLRIYWEGGMGDRLPSYAKYCLQDEQTKLFNAVVWIYNDFNWRNQSPGKTIKHPFIYEAHVGMATEKENVGSFNYFTENILPRINKAGYNTVQLMAIQEHPYYGSFGYHVSNFFAVSSRFGSPDDLKRLIDTAHGMGIMVIMDIVHSHAVKNENEGLGKFDGTPDLYFHSNERREHVAWDSLCFNYGKEHVLHFLLSNCKFWLEEYKFDGFRFDGVTSMLYYDHGLSRDFTSYAFYYDGNQDVDAINYLGLANLLIHEVNPYAITIAEEMSGMPGLAEPITDGGIGFDYRMAMGIPDYWIKLIKERADESWNVSEMFHELTSRRTGEKTINYAESHDQALVGDKTIIFRLLDKEMYWNMNKSTQSLVIDRGMALHKMLRLITFATNGGGYLNFMGNEFGHPEWIDFPREGNNWSYKYARRQWSLLDNKDLKFYWLADFDRDMLNLEEQYAFLHEKWCNLKHENRENHVLAFDRGLLLFVFNFSPDRAFTDYGIHAHPGKYSVVLNTDSPDYGGFGNINESIAYVSSRSGGVGGQDWLKLYLPPRTAIVLKRKPTPSIYDVQ